MRFLGPLKPLKQIQRLVARAFPPQPVEAGMRDHGAAREDFADGGAAMGGPGDADGGAAMRAGLLPAAGRRGRGGVGAEIDRRGDLRALRPVTRIAEVFLAMDPHMGPPSGVCARDSREGLKEGVVS